MVQALLTPEPLAVQESRFLGLRGRAWLVTELLDGPDLMTAFAPYVDSGDVPEEQLAALQQLLAQLIHERISHGDLKAYNLFWKDGQWALIDLDAMAQHATQMSFAPAFAKDRARLLRNWPVESALYKRLDECLPKLG